VDAAVYYAEHFDKMKTVLYQLNEEDAASIATAKPPFRKPGIREQLAYIKTCLGQLPDLSAILQLEEIKLSLAYRLNCNCSSRAV